jgi:hypothetical protein
MKDSLKIFIIHSKEILPRLPNMLSFIITSLNNILKKKGGSAILHNIVDYEIM